jgi:hypothetical protein
MKKEKRKLHRHPDASLNARLQQDLTPSKQPIKKKFKLTLTKKRIIIGILIFVLLTAAAIFYFLHLHKKTQVPISKPKAVNLLVPSTLSGLPVTPSINLRPVTAVMVENSTDARPQSGLDQASVVFEAVAEGGITRFMAVYQDSLPAYIGPVRSARPYYVSWALGFDASYAHVGGSAEGLHDIQAWGVKDLDQFYNDSAYQRITSRYAPHNVYTGFPQLTTLEQAKGYTSSKFTGFPRKADATTPTPKASKIDFSISGSDYDAHFDYLPSTNSYSRSQAGAPHMVVDQNGVQKQITPKVVIAMVVPIGQGALDASNAYYSDYTTVGSGQAFVFQDGDVTLGTWAKTANSAQISFTDSSGNVLKLNAGKTWITAVSDAGSVSYKN